MSFRKETRRRPVVVHTVVTADELTTVERRVQVALVRKWLRISGLVDPVCERAAASVNTDAQTRKPLEGRM